MKLLDERGLTTVWAAIKNTFTSKSDADEKYAKKSEGVKAIRLKKTQTGDDGAMSQLIHVIKANDGQNFLSIYNADNRMDGFMSKEDKVKLDGIASGANNYSLPVASGTTLGGIKVFGSIGNTNNSGYWPIYINSNGVIHTIIDGLNANDFYDGISNIIIKNNNYSTKYTPTVIERENLQNGIFSSINLPPGSGTLALESDIPTKTSQLTNDSGFLKQGDFECTINIYLIDTQLNSDKLKGVSITIEQQGEDVLYVIWDGSPISFTADAKAKIKISVSHADGYITPNAVEFKTVIGRDEDITFTYTPAPLGVYICDTDNKLTLPDNWDSSNNYKAVGVYVGTENSWFVIAPTLSDSSNIVWSYTDHVIPGVATSINSEVAKKDYAGKTNTDKIIAELGTGSRYAARYCRDYTFKNGKKGYLWSLGEALDAFNNEAAINQALGKIGGSQMSTNEYFWTSTQYNNYRAWKLGFLYGDEADDSKDSLCRIRAVCAI